MSSSLLSTGSRSAFLILQLNLICYLNTWITGTAALKSIFRDIYCLKFPPCKESMEKDLGFCLLNYNNNNKKPQQTKQRCTAKTNGLPSISQGVNCLRLPRGFLPWSTLLTLHFYLQLCIPHHLLSFPFLAFQQSAHAYTLPYNLLCLHFASMTAADILRRWLHLCCPGSLFQTRSTSYVTRHIHKVSRVRGWHLAARPNVQETVCLPISWNSTYFQFPWEGWLLRVAQTG